MAVNQAYLFLVFTINGVFIGLLFDFFRILRKCFKTINVITYLEDIIFWILTGLSIIFSMYYFSNGSLRFFMFLGLGFGITMYLLLLSNLIIQVSVFIISIIKKILKIINTIIITPLKILYNVLVIILFNPLYFVFIKLRTFLNKKTKNITYKFNNMKNIKKQKKIAS